MIQNLVGIVIIESVIVLWILVELHQIALVPCRNTQLSILSGCLLGIRQLRKENLELVSIDDVSSLSSAQSFLAPRYAQVLPSL